LKIPRDDSVDQQPLSDFGSATDVVGTFGVECDYFVDLPPRQSSPVSGPSRDGWTVVRQPHTVCPL